MAHWWGAEDTFSFWGATFVIIVGLLVSSERISITQAILEFTMQQPLPLNSAAYLFAGIIGTCHHIRHFLFALPSMLPVSQKTMNAIWKQIAKRSIAALSIMTCYPLPLAKGRQHLRNSDSLVDLQWVYDPLSGILCVLENDVFCCTSSLETLLTLELNCLCSKTLSIYCLVSLVTFLPANEFVFFL